MLWSTLRMLVEVSYYIDISTKNLFSMTGHILTRVFPCAPSFGGVTIWPLSAVLMAASRNLYFAVACQQDTKLTRVQRWLTFLLSRHTVWPKLRLSRQPPSSCPPAETYHHSPQLESPTGGLCTVLHLCRGLNKCCSGCESISCWFPCSVFVLNLCAAPGCYLGVFSIFI